MRQESDELRQSFDDRAGRRKNVKVYDCVGRDTRPVHSRRCGRVKNRLARLFPRGERRARDAEAAKKTPRTWRDQRLADSDAILALGAPATSLGRWHMMSRERGEHSARRLRGRNFGRVVGSLSGVSHVARRYRERLLVGYGELAHDISLVCLARVGDLDNESREEIWTGRSPV
ncbi:unnamed protein product, partial [Iphiclides podalirius]